MAIPEERVVVGLWRGDGSAVLLSLWCHPLAQTLSSLLNPLRMEVSILRMSQYRKAPREVKRIIERVALTTSQTDKMVTRMGVIEIPSKHNPIIARR